ncbi:HAD family hydrolase [Kribbella sp. C-35]|uniref:HAD family hydrolase n=1 Tax=Kribbella sp. C-35 TaxID=2789276 RepID=UPI00397A193B
MRHVVWDWNGTLLNDNHAVLAAVNEVCAGFGRAELSWGEWQAAYARPMRLSYEQILQRTLDEEEWAQVDSLIRHLQAQQLDPSDVVLIGDVVDDADAARAAGARCVLVTTGAMTLEALQTTGAPVTASITQALQLLDA